MHVGLVMECDYREGRTQEEAFAEAMDIAEIAETDGLDGVWLAERHFAMHRRPTDPMGAGIPSIAAVPLVLGAAIAARTSRVRIGTGVSVLPLCHPIRTAEEAATVDQISKGRLDFGVGRSGFPRAYSGYGVRYDESRERFQESLDLILKAWTQDGFTHTGKYFATDNLTVVPRPYQKPHPPIWVAATTPDTFAMVGRMGYSLVTGLRGFDVPEAVGHLAAYRAARREHGHAGDGNVYLRIPVFVADTAAQARSEPEESTMRSYRRLAENFASSVGATGSTTARRTWSSTGSQSCATSSACRVSSLNPTSAGGSRSSACSTRSASTRERSPRACADRNGSFRDARPEREESAMTNNRRTYVYVGLAGETAPGRPVKSGLYRMAAGDDRWELATRGLPAAPAIRAIATHPESPEIVFVGTQDGPYRSSDHGEHWDKLDVPDHGLPVWSLAFDPRNAQVVYAGYENCEIYCSEDGGERWRQLPVTVRFPEVTVAPGSNPAKRVLKLAANPANPDEIYGAIEVGGVIRSLDGGEHWENMSHGQYVNDDTVDMHGVLVGRWRPGQ